MSTCESSPPPASRQVKALFLLEFAGSALILSLFVFKFSPNAQVPAAFILPGVLVIASLLAIAIVRAGPSPLPLGLFLIGMMIIIGGALLDITATIVHSPDLANESNPIARAFLDRGYGVPLVYVYVTFCQTMYVSVLVLSWAALLRHRGAIIDSVRGARTRMQFLKAATGGSQLTWRQWCLPLRLAELPQAYPLFWVLTIILLTGTIDRWYLGFEWHGLVSGLRWFVMGIGMAAGLIVYFAWLWLASQTQRLSGESLDITGQA